MWRTILVYGVLLAASAWGPQCPVRLLVSVISAAILKNSRVLPARASVH